MKEGEDVTQETWVYHLTGGRGDAHVDPEKAAGIEVVYIEDSTITGGVMRARTVERITTEYGVHKAKHSVTRWGSKSKGPDLSAGASVLRDALAGDWDGQ